MVTMSSTSSKWILKQVANTSSTSSLEKSIASLKKLELFLTRRLDVNDGEPVELISRHDAHWLQCGTMAPSSSIATILGIPEDYHGYNQENNDVFTTQQDFIMNWTAYEACSVAVDIKQSPSSPPTITIDEVASAPNILIDYSNPRRGLHSDWSRNPRRDGLKDTSYATGGTEDTCKSTLSLWWVDSRAIQSNQSHSDPIEWRQEDVVQLFRAVMTCDHNNSPWYTKCHPKECLRTESEQPDVVVLAMQPVHSLTTMAKDLRVSDVAPSWFLHAQVKLEILESPSGIQPCLDADSSTRNAKNVADLKISPATLLIYKILGPRTNISADLSTSCIARELHQEYRHHLPTDGCLWESYPTEQLNEDESSDEQNSINPDSGQYSVALLSIRLVCQQNRRPR